VSVGRSGQIVEGDAFDPVPVYVPLVVRRAAMIRSPVTRITRWAERTSCHAGGWTSTLGPQRFKCPRGEPS